MSEFATQTETESEVHYQVIRPLAKGGCGEIFLAIDDSLHRTVALKTISKEYCDDPEMRNRFQVEAELTGKLEHPAIVPVYTLQHDKDGYPFYAMRLIRGEDLQQVVKRLYKTGEPDNLTFRKLLGRFTMVCQAVAHAHRRGVIHRDIKPKNIMLGPNDETLLVDWGLAKLLPIDPRSTDRPANVAPRRETAASVLPETEPRSLLDIEAEMGETRLGAAVGTPGFMSPEQAMGLVDQVGPPSDIYSLGATLYVLLTGWPPFLAEDAFKIAEKSVVGDFLPPRKVRPSLDPGLEAICLKAMAMSPEARYESAEQIADDINAYLADEPVQAWREPFTYRLRRRSRRHLGTVIVGMGSLLVISLILSCGVISLTEANRREKAARLDAHQRQVEAENNLLLAMRSVDRFMTRVADDPVNEGRIDAGLRSELLGDAREFFETFVQIRPKDAPLTVEWARVHLRLAQIDDAVGEQASAVGRAREAIDILTALIDHDHAERQPPADETLQELAVAHDRLGAMLLEQGEIAEARKEMESARSFYDKLLERHPDVAALRIGPASILQNLAKLDYDSGQREEAIRKCEEAIALLQPIADTEPGLDKCGAQLAVLKRNLGVMLQNSDRQDDALLAYRDAVALQRQLILRNPGPSIQSDLAQTLADTGVLLSNDESSYSQASEYFEAAITNLRLLVVAQPKIVEYQHRLAQTLNNYASLLVSLDKPFDAVQAMDESLRLQRRLVARSSGVASSRLHLLSSLGNQAWLMACLGRAEECTALCSEARTLLDTIDEKDLEPDRREQAENHLRQIERLLTEQP